MVTDGREKTPGGVAPGTLLIDRPAALWSGMRVSIPQETGRIKVGIKRLRFGEGGICKIGWGYLAVAGKIENEILAVKTLRKLR
jgi:hypothetical protein